MMVHEEAKKFQKYVTKRAGQDSGLDPAPSQGKCIDQIKKNLNKTSEKVIKGNI